MLGLFEKLGPHVKGVLSKKVSADNVVFRLHYRLTVMLLLLGCFLVTTIEFIGDPILCMPSTLSGDDYDPENDPFVKACNTYCWIMSTFTLPQLHDKEVGVEVAHPGVGPPPKDAEMKYHAYYQWVPFFLLLQSIMFYATHFLWKNLEGGTLKGVLNGLDDLVLDKEAREGKEKQVVKYLKLTRGKHSCWYLQYVICEILNFCHVVGQIYFTDKFLGYEFTTYGAEVFEFLESDEENRTDPMTKVFPKVTKCTFHTVGPSGSIQIVDNLCVLPLNIVNEKIYAFYWFWFVVLASLSGLALLYRAATLLSGFIRMFLLRLRAGNRRRRLLEEMAQKLGRSDWFLLYNLGKHMDPVHYQGFLGKLGKELNLTAGDWNEVTPLSSNHH